MGLPKTYRVVARLGWTSDTGDRDGAARHTGRVPERLELPTGRLLQRPPAYSAVHVDGERLYARARRGDPVEGEPRPVDVYALRAAVARRASGRAFEVECSAGTYVRQLVAGARRRLLRGARAHADRPVAPRGRRPRAARGARRRPRLPAGARARRRRGRARRPRRAAARSRPGDGPTGPCASCTATSSGGGRAARGRVAAPRSVRAAMKVTRAPRRRAAPAARRHRHVRRRPPRPPRGHPRRRHRAHLRAPPACRRPARGAAAALDSPAIKRDLIAALGVEELVVIPFDRGSPRSTPRTSSTTSWSSGSAPTQVSVGENFRFGTRGARRRRAARPPPEFETRVVPLVEVGGETVSSSRIRALVARRRGGDGGGVPGPARSCSRARWSRRPARPRARDADGQHRARRGPRRARPRGLRRAGPRTARRR